MIYDLANVVLSLASQCVQPIKIISLFLSTSNKQLARFVSVSKLNPN